MTLLLVHAAATLALGGLIWTIQLVHYPLMDEVDRANFGRFHARHASRITWLVGPLMLTELGTSIWIAVSPPPGVSAAVAWFGLGLTLTAWAATALISVPAHARLGAGFESMVHTRLVRTNWIRTAAWSARGAIALWMIAQHAAASPLVA